MATPNINRVNGMATSNTSKVTGKMSPNSSASGICVFTSDVISEYGMYVLAYDINVKVICLHLWYQCQGLICFHLRFDIVGQWHMCLHLRYQWQWHIYVFTYDINASGIYVFNYDISKVSSMCTRNAMRLTTCLNQITETNGELRVFLLCRWDSVMPCLHLISIMSCHFISHLAVEYDDMSFYQSSCCWSQWHVILPVILLLRMMTCRFTSQLAVKTNDMPFYQSMCSWGKVQCIELHTAKKLKSRLQRLWAVSKCAPDFCIHRNARNEG